MWGITKTSKRLWILYYFGQFPNSKTFVWNRRAKYNLNKDNLCLFQSDSCRFRPESSGIPGFWLESAASGRNQWRNGKYWKTPTMGLGKTRVPVARCWSLSEARLKPTGQSAARHVKVVTCHNYPQPFILGRYFYYIHNWSCSQMLKLLKKKFWISSSFPHWCYPWIIYHFTVPIQSIRRTPWPVTDATKFWFRRTTEDGVTARNFRRNVRVCR